MSTARDRATPLRRRVPCYLYGRFCGVPAVVMALAVFSAGPAFAEHEGSQHYSRFTQSCPLGGTENLADPIGVLFFGDVRHAHANGHSHRVFGLLDSMPDPDHAWNTTDADPQFVGSGGACTSTEYQVATGYEDLADGHEEEARYHLRLNQNSSPGPGGDWRTVATPHYDVHINEPGCEDSVPPDQPATPNRDSGFDLARGHVKNDWIAAYGGMVADVQNWRNTRLIHQCNPNDDWDSGSSGRVYYLDSDEAN